MKLSTTLVTATIPTFARDVANIGLTKAREMVRDGVVETITIGARRLVVVDSYRRLIEKELAGPPKDARRNNHVPALGSYTGRRGRPRKHQPTVTAAG
jgi:hypothetical protein